MFNEAKTIEFYNYNPNIKLVHGKEIYMICDYCKKEYHTNTTSIIRGRAKINKDACKYCRNIKSKEVLNIKYGVDSNFERKDVQNKCKNTIKTKYNVDNVSQIKSVIEKKKNTFRKKFEGKMLSEWATKKNKAVSTFGQQVKKYGLEKALQIQDNRSGLELLIEDILPKNSNVISKIKTGKIRPDFIVNNFLVIECDGLYWHSDAILKNPNFHFDRRKYFIKKGYRPLFFREDEILNKIQIIKSIINNCLNQSIKIYARKCDIESLNKNNCKSFFKNNHLMKNGQGECYGLYYNNDLVSCIQIINLKDSIKISRFCNKKFHTVVGGLSKLLKFIHKKYNPKKIISFVDLRYGNGRSLEKIGFNKIREQPSFKWTKNQKTVHRMKFPKDSGYKEGWFKIWDCGQAKYEMNYVQNS